ncbi:tyrosine-type recombinase/integrase [Microbacterium sp. 11MF]|uniref:tyrosine-type recombinase/integrase n=1 Tax=Microbacterium sp. 11MF TaxID=1169146 RepID=UPI0009DC0B52|nr:site-specific integrase [Microbacterium sp. 11MF]
MASIGVRTTASGGVRYRVQSRHRGQQLQATFLDIREAESFRSLVEKVGWEAARSVVAARRRESTGTLTLTDWVTKYLDPQSGLLTGVEAATRRDYLRDANRSFLQVLGDMPVDSITKADVGRWVTWQESQTTARNPNQRISAKTVRNYHAVLSAVMTSAVDNGLRPDNPARKTRLSRGEQHEGVFLSVDEYTTLLHFIPEQYAAFVILLANTGCRWGEATALTWGDLDNRSNPPTIRVSKAWKKSDGGGPVLKHPKSSRSRRTISLPHDAVVALGTRGPSDALIFANSNGGHLWMGRFRASAWDPAVAKATNPTACGAAGLMPLRRKPTPHDQPDAHVQMAEMIGATLAGTRPMRAITTKETR